MSSRLLWVVAVSVAMTACQGSKHQVRKQAPTGPKDTGVLVETQNAERIDAVLKAYPQAQVRQLNPAHGIYEIFGVTREQVEQIAPEAEISNNEFFEFKLQSVPAPKGLKVDGLNPCQEGDNGPTAVAAVSEPTGLPNAFTIELGKKIKVSARNSQPSAQHPGPIKTALVFIPPGSSTQRQTVKLGDELEIATDALGAYQVYLVVQDSRDVCALDGVQFIATANRKYERVTEGGRVDLNKLSHLNLVDAVASRAHSEGEGILIAIIDTGVNYNHPLLSSNIELNVQESNATGADKDGNGLADDELGYDFINSDPFPYDDDGHGTHVAGLAAGRQIGMAPKARILAVKSMTSVGGDAGSIAAGVIYATDRGAKIINMSLGTTGPRPHPLIVKSMDYAKAKGVLVVIAAGNGDPRTGLGFDIDQSPVWPASLTHDNILTVGATDARNTLTPYSNFGKVGVDLTAPGGFGREPLYSTAFENPTGAKLIGMSGTSMASPVVAGIAAQVWSINSSLTALQVKAVLMKAGPQDETLKEITVSGRHLNANDAVMAVSPTNALF